MIKTVKVTSHLCVFCFDYSSEFYKWSGSQVYMDQGERLKAYNQFSEYALERLSKPCIEIYLDVEKTYICLECLTEMVNLLRKYNDQT